MSECQYPNCELKGYPVDLMTNGKPYCCFNACETGKKLWQEKEEENERDNAVKDARNVSEEQSSAGRRI